MISEEVYRLLHYSSIFILIASISAIFFTKGEQGKGAMIIMGVSSLFVLVGGMGLILRALGLAHGGDESWPIWIWAKIFIWGVISFIAPLLAKRLSSPTHRNLAGLFFIFLFVVAASLVVFGHGH